MTDNTFSEKEWLVMGAVFFGAVFLILLSFAVDTLR